MNMALSESGEFAEGLDLEEAMNLLIASGKMLPNASYFAFTATPKPKTLEVFGERFEQGGEVRFRLHHTYSMEQAIEEGFIVELLAHYTPVQSLYRLATALEDDDPELDTRKAQKKLRRYVEGDDHAIRRKAEMIADHFLDRVMAKRKLGGEARAMVVTAGIERAFQPIYQTTLPSGEADPNRLQDADGGLTPYNESGGSGRAEPELAPLSEILRAFNERWANIEWKDSDRIERVLVEELPAKLAANEAYRNAMQRGNAYKARIELEVALKGAIIDMLSDHADLFKAYSDEPAFRGWLADAMFNATYRPGSDAAS